MTDIPLNGDEVVHEVTVTRRKNRILTSSKPVCVPLPPTPQHTDTLPSTPELDGDVYSDAEGIDLVPETRNRERKGPSRSVSVSFLAFAHILLLTTPQTQIEECLKFRDEFTDEVMRHEGLAESPSPPPCQRCSEPNAIYRCLDCMDKCMLCQHCIVTTHRLESLHSIQVRPTSTIPHPLIRILPEMDGRIFHQDRVS